MNLNIHHNRCTQLETGQALVAGSGIAPQHRYAAMFELRLPAALEVLHATIGRKACRVPEFDGVLHAELTLKGVDDHLFAKLRLLLWGLEWSGPSTTMLKVFDALLGIKNLYP